jgi:peptide/nickel transport system permease protein
MRINYSIVVSIFIAGIIVFRHDAIWDQMLITAGLVSALFSGELSSSHLTFFLFDSIFNLLIFVGLVVTLIFRKRFKLLLKRISLIGFGVCVILIVLLFAPTISNWDPAFQKDLSVTKLLPPFSKVKILNLKESNSSIQQNENNLNKLLKPDLGRSIIFVDSLEINSGVKYFQGRKSQIIDNDRVELSSSGSPLISTKVFLLGTDEFGRDIFSRIIYGARVSIFIALGSVILSLFIASVLGFISAYYGKWANIILNRTAETIIALPVLFLIVLTLALFGNNIFSILFVLGTASWMSLFKVIHNEIISIKKKDFFVTAQLIGLSKTRLFINEIFPVIRIPVIINCVLLFGNIILAEAALSYLGLGLGNTLPSWGAMIDSGQNYMNHAWWMITFPGLSLIFTLLIINELGNKLNKIFNQNIL